MNMDRKEIKINGRKYVLEPIPADDAAAFGLEVLQVVATPLSAVLGTSGLSLASLGDGKNLDDKTVSKMTAMFLRSIPQLDMPQVSSIFKRAFAGTMCTEGKLDDKGVRDQYFQNFPSDYYPVAIWAAFTHSKDFLFGAMSGLKEVFLGMAPESQSPSLTGSK